MAAGAKPAVSVEGRDETRRGFRKMSERADDLDVPDAAAGDILLAEARRNAPRRTGTLRDSLEVVPDYPGVRVTSDLVYAAPIHYGWPARNIDAQPFLDESIATVATEIVKPYDDHADDLVRKFDRETPG